MKMTVHIVKAQESISKKSEEELLNSFAMGDSLLLERRETCKKPLQAVHHVAAGHDSRHRTS